MKPTRKSIGRRKKKASKNPKIELSVDEKKANKRERLEAKMELARKRGGRVDFTTAKLGSKSVRGKTIVKCGICGRKGEISGALRPSALVIHRGKILTGETLIRSTDFCVNSPGTIKAQELQRPTYEE
jgi:hypothetical protein